MEWSHIGVTKYDARVRGRDLVVWYGASITPVRSCRSLACREPQDENDPVRVIRQA